MACYHPIPAYQGGSEPPRLHPPVGTANLELPCGKCIGCRTDRATQWALRAEHEASRWEHNTFLTLTYDDDSLPTAGHLVPRHLQLFLKRLRKNANSSGSSIDRMRCSGIRYLACGEYGDHTGRPHYHAVLFNCGFRDRRAVGRQHGRDVYTSDTVAKLWTDPKTGRPYGHHQVGDATGAAAAYVAQYTLKKQYRPRERWAEAEGYADEDGVWHEKPQPFLRMSLKPAIGYEWLKRFSADLQHGYLVANGRRHGIPRYYRNKLQETNSEAHELAEYLTERRKIQTVKTTRPEDRASNPERRLAAELMHKRRKELNENRKL